VQEGAGATDKPDDVPDWIGADDAGHGIATEPLPSLVEVEAAVAVIPNDDLGWDDWCSVGLTIYAACGGAWAGLDIFDRWSRKSAKYDEKRTLKKWQEIRGCPPDRTGFGKLEKLADAADPEWRKKIKPEPAAGGDGKGPAKPAAGELRSVRAATVEMEALEWFWPNRFALGKIGIVAGLPDEGKGLLLSYMAACCTNAALSWPCSEGEAPRGNVILLTAEDDLADTVVPRLTAAGADRSKVEIVGMVHERDTKTGEPRQRMFSLVRDLDKLRAKIAEVGNVALIVIDPISAYLGIGEIDSFRDADVRAVLGPLKELAGETQAAIVALMHFNKKVDVLNMMLRICNSIAFAAASRHAFGVVDDPDNNRKLFVRGKNNLARKDDRALAFHFDEREVGTSQRSGKPIVAPFIVWEAGYVDVTATEALQAVSEHKAPAARDLAKKFLLRILAKRPMLVTEIEDAAKAERISVRTLARAKAALNIIAEKENKPDGKWLWRLTDGARL
jgi:hypothetical protein